MVQNFHGNSSFFKDLQNKKASYLLGASVTHTLDIEGISQAGLPGKIHLTPTLDAEFITDCAMPSLDELPSTPGGAPTPALAVRAVQELSPFSEMTTLDLGLEVVPQLTNGKCVPFNIAPSDRIDTTCDLPAEEIFLKGQEYGRSFETSGEYTILAESTPAGTTTARATAEALGYNAKGYFSSSFHNKPTSIKEKTIEKAIARINDTMSRFEKLGKVSDNMLLFTAGFVSTATAKGKIVLGGGTQMSAALLILDSLSRDNSPLLKDFVAENCSLLTTKWVFRDEMSDIAGIFGQMSIPVSGFYSPFSFESAELPPMKLYDQGEAKEGVGMGAALGYGLLNGLTVEEIVARTERFLK